MDQWASSASYSLRNERTGMYLAAHPDGQLVAEDDTIRHHDVPWSICNIGDGRVALRSCHGKYLDTDGNGLPTNNAQDPNQAAWVMTKCEQNGYSLRSRDGRFLKAVPPNGEQQQVLLSDQCGQSEIWNVEAMSAVVAAVDNVEGQFV